LGVELERLAALSLEAQAGHDLHVQCLSMWMGWQLRRWPARAPVVRTPGDARPALRRMTKPDFDIGDRQDERGVSPNAIAGRDRIAISWRRQAPDSACPPPWNRRGRSLPHAGGR